jgi:surface protein
MASNDISCRNVRVAFMTLFFLAWGGASGAEKTAPDWVRPADWTPLPELTAGEQKLVGLFAVHPDRENYAGLSATGDFRVDWGDGTAPESFKAGSTAEHFFDHSTCGGAVCSRGYKMVIVTLTPEKGQSLTQIDLNKQRGDDRLTGWLDLTISSRELTDLKIGWRNPCVCHRLLEQVTIREHRLTDTSYLFNICESLQSVPMFNTSGITKMDAMFWGAMKLRTIPPFDTSNVTSMGDMFRECYELVDVPQLDTSKVTTMSCMFRYAISLRTVPLFDTANVTNMTMMFQYCWNLQRVPLFNTVRVTNMRWMFQNCFLLKSIPKFDTSRVTDMRSLFSGAQSLLVVPALDTGMAEDFSGTFDGCGQITQNRIQGAVRDLDLRNQHLSGAELNRVYAGLGTVKGQTIQVSGNYGIPHHDPSIATSKGWVVKADLPAGMKFDADAKPTPPATGDAVELALPVKGPGAWVRPADWAPLPEVAPGEQKMVGLLAVLPFDDNVVALSAAGDYEVDWGDGSARETFKAGSTAGHRYDYATCPGVLSSRGYKTVVVTVTPLAGQALTVLDLHKRHSAFAHSSVASLRTNWLDLFISGDQLASLAIGSKETTVLHLLLERVRIQEHRLTSTDFLFHQCSSLESVPLFDTSEVTSMIAMFSGARSISHIPPFDTRNVTNMLGMFANCGSLTGLPMLDTSKVTIMSGMFRSAFLLRAVPHWDTSSVTNMAGMFENAWRLGQVPPFNTSRVTNMQRMFRQVALINLPPFDTSKVEDMREMFYWTLRLESVPELDASNVKDFTGIFGSGAEGRCRMLLRNGLKGMAHDIDVSHQDLSASELNRVFSNLATVKGKVISIDVNEGAAACDRSIATDKGWIINQPPVVNAGTDVTVTLPDTVTLKATTTDDGYPEVPEGITYVWSFGGWAAGPVQFSPQRSQSVTLTFTTPGRYVFRCAVCDGHLTAEDDVVVTVKAKAAGAGQ